MAQVKMDSLIHATGSFFDDCQFLSPDTLLLLGVHTNLVALTDSSGRVLKVYDFMNLMKLYNVELATRIEYCKGRVSMGTFYHNRYDSLGQNLQTECDFMKRRRVTPRVIQIDTFPYSAPKAIGLNFYQRFSDESDHVVELCDMLCMDSVTILNSSFSDSLYVYDLDGRLTKVVGLKSDHIPLKVKPVNCEVLATDLNASNEALAKSCYISRVLRDDYRHLYYCIAIDRYGSPEGSSYVIVLDDDFRQLDEFAFPNADYHPSGAFVGQKGLYIRHQANYFLNPTYTIFRYER